MSDAVAAPSSAPAAATSTTAPTTPAASAPAASKSSGQATETPKAPQVTPAEKRKYSLKVDGKEEALELSDEEVVTRLQKAHAADKRMDESAQIRKAFKEFQEFVKKDPWAALKDPAFGIDLEKEAERRLIEKYQLELMTPEQRAQKERELQLEQYKKQAETAQAELAKRQQAEIDQRTFQQTESSFIAALSEAGMEKSYEALYEMARIADLALEQGIEYSPKQLAAQVQEQLEGRRGKLEKAVVGGLKGDKLLSHLGDEVVNEVLRARIAQVRGGVQTPPTAVEPKASEGKYEKAKGAERFQGTQSYRGAWRDVMRGK